MAVVAQLLKYQQVDSKLLAMERELSGSEERKKMYQARSFIEKATERLDSLEAKAKELFALIADLKKKCDYLSEQLSDFTNIEEMVSDGADISFYKKNILQLTEQIRDLRAKTASLLKTAQDADKEYKQLKAKTIEMQTKQKEYSEAFKKLKEDKMDEMLAVQKELDELKKEINPETMKRYEIKRSERIFPIICAVKGGRCSQCGTELSISANEAVQHGDPIECDNCHRFLYKE